MTQGRKWRMPNVHPMLLLDITSAWNLSSWKNDEFCSREQTHFVQDVYFRTHTKNTYTVHIIRKFMTQGWKWWVPNCHPILLLDKTSILSLITCENVELSLVRPKHFVQDVFLRTHTHKIHTLHIPFKSLWPKDENDGCQIVIRYFCSIKRVF